MLPRVFLKRDKERPVLARHPWLFSGAVERVEGDPADGDSVEVYGAGGRLGRGYYNSRSQIRVRMWTLADEPVDGALLRARLATAIALRERCGLRFADAGAETTAFRLVNAESDLLPGLVVDAYGRQLVLQCLTAGIERRKQELCDLLVELLEPDGIYERSDVEVREKEGLAPASGPLRGAVPPPTLEVRESGQRLVVDLRRGQKTGLYLDQRENRRRLAELVRARVAAAPDEPLAVLNAFSYSGGFGLLLAAAAPRARITNLDSSADALELARANFAAAGCADRAEQLCGDAFHELRRMRDAARAFDVVVLDPPKFAHGRGQVVAACRGYKDLNLLACKLLRPGGLLATCSCSGLVGAELFQKVVFDAAHDAGRYARVLARLAPGPDHPTLLSFPEGDYLKGLIVALD